MAKANSKPDAASIGIANLIKLKNNKMYSEVVRFARISTFYIGMEMLLTVYIIEMVVLLTTFFSRDGSIVTIKPFIIFFPLIIAIPLTLFCLVWALQHFQSKANEYAQTYAAGFKDETLPASENEGKKDFSELIREHRLNSRSAAVRCVIFYFLISLIIAFVLNLCTHSFNKKFFVCVVGIAVLLGFLWNMDAYYRHQRILWSRLYPNLSPESKKADVENNCKVFKRSIFWIVVSMLVLLGLFTFVLWFFHSKNSTIKELLDNGYGTLIFPFFSLVIIYVKLVYSLTFKNTGSDVILCPTLDAVLSEHPDYKPDGQLTGTKNPADQGAGQPEQGQGDEPEPPKQEQPQE